MGYGDIYRNIEDVLDGAPDDPTPRLTADELEEIRETLAGPDAIVDAHLTARTLLAELDATRADLSCEAQHRRALEKDIGDAMVELTTLLPGETTYQVDAPSSQVALQARSVRAEGNAWKQRALTAEENLQVARDEQARLHRQIDALRAAKIELAKHADSALELANRAIAMSNRHDELLSSLPNPLSVFGGGVGKKDPKP